MDAESFPTDKELAILQLLWQHGPSPIRRLTEWLYPDASPSNYATVQKLLERLENKKCVQRDRTSMIHIFHPLIQMDDYIGMQLRVMADKLCGGSMTPLLTHLVQGEALRVEERQELRRLMNEADPE